jgi:putative CocE/NonD family hydrolase
MSPRLPLSLGAIAIALAAAAVACASIAQTSSDRNYRVEEVMAPMRDGTGLFTVIVIPNVARDAPILLTRTPFGASARLFKPKARAVGDLLGEFERPLVEDGYIRVFQDTRGRGRSAGTFRVTQPARGPLNGAAVDEATDAYDTIDYLVKHLPQSNGQVGMIGWSYDGFTSAMALLEPHPALKAAVMIDPMIDGWMGDDWFHYGAFRQSTLDFIAAMSGKFAAFGTLHPEGADDFAAFLKAGSASGMAQAAGLQDDPFWRSLTENPGYGPYWRGQALDGLLAHRPASGAATLWVSSLWDQEDSWGATHGYAALEAGDPRNDRNFLVLGPWRHAGVTGDGSHLGPLAFGADTAAQFRTAVLKPFLDQHLKRGARADIAPVQAFLAGANQWLRMDRWPQSPERSRFYLGPDFTLTDQPPSAPGADRYRADPVDPVPYMARPVHGDDPELARNWLVADQQFLRGRADVLSYRSPPLTKPLRVSGAPMVDLYAATTGGDADWVVKLIDVFPDTPQTPPGRRGYQLIIAADIFRGRYREGFDRPRPLRPGATLHYRFALPPANYELQPGHRLMVQVQSSWFPFYDRNPQSFVENIFLAPPDAYRPAEQTLSRSPGEASSISF